MRRRALPCGEVADRGCVRAQEEMAPAPAPGDMEGSMPPESSPTDEQLIEELFDEDTYEVLPLPALPSTSSSLATHP